MDKKKIQEKLEALHQLKKIMQHTKDKRIYASVIHISNTGMSRVIKFYTITKNGSLYNLNGLINNITGYAWDKNYYGLRVYGCGMDMIFNTLYNVNCIAAHYHVIKTSKKKTKHDLYYSGLVNSNYYSF